MKSKLAVVITISILLATVLPAQLDAARGDNTVPSVRRVFYFSATRDLAALAPSNLEPKSLNMTRGYAEFGSIAPLVNTVTVSGRMNLSLWISSNTTTTLSLNSTFSEQLVNGQWRNASELVFPQPLVRGVKEYSFPGDIRQSLDFLSHIFIRLRTNVGPRANVTLLWGAGNYPSRLVLPLSGYISLDPSKPLEILNRAQSPATDFDLNSTNNVIFFRAFVVSAFGPSDILRANLTVVDPSSRPVRGATNRSLTPVPFSLPQSLTSTWTTSWIYPSNATAGIYQLFIDIFDGQINLAYSFRGPSSFRLFRGLFPGQSLLLLPYVGLGGAAVGISGLVYYRRRRAKSYLVPFDYFNTLTGGELDGGTVVAVEGNTGSGKTLLSEQLLHEDLKKGRPCVFVVTGDFPSNIRANMKAMGLDIEGYEQSGLLTFVDGYSSEAGQESREKFAIPSLGDLTTLGIKITSSLPRDSFKSGSLYFDSLTPLASKTKPESIVSFVQSLGARVKGMDGKAFFTVGPSIDGKVQRQIEEMADCVIQMEAFEERGVRKSRLRIGKYRARRYQQGWVIYTIEEGKGIIFYSKRPRQ